MPVEVCVQMRGSDAGKFVDLFSWTRVLDGATVTLTHAHKGALDLRITFVDDMQRRLFCGQLKTGQLRAFDRFFLNQHRQI